MNENDWQDVGIITFLVVVGLLLVWALVIMTEQSRNESLGLKTHFELFESLSCPEKQSFLLYSSYDEYVDGDRYFKKYVVECVEISDEKFEYLFEGKQ